MAFEPFSLADVLSGAEHIKGMRQRSSYMQLQESALGEDIQNSRSNRELQNRQYTAEQQRANTEWLANSTDRVLADPDPVATARGLIPEAVKRGIVPAGVDVSDGLDLDEIRQINKQAKLVLGMPVEQAQPQSPQGKVAADRESGLLTQDEAARTLSAPTDDGTPSNVREWQFFERLKPEQQQQYLEMKRSLQIETIGQVPTVVRGGGTQPLSTLPAEASAAATVKGAEALASGQAQNQADAEAAAPKLVERARQQVAAIDNTFSSIDEALGEVDLWTAGPIGNVLKNFSGTRAKDLEQTVLTIKANIGFDRLQQMREASPTGGALGQVAVQELGALQASIAALDQAQTPGQMVQNLRRVRRHYEGWRDTVTQANESSDGTPGIPRAGDVVDGFRFKGGDPANEASWEKP